VDPLHAGVSAASTASRTSRVPTPPRRKYGVHRSVEQEGVESFVPREVHEANQLLALVGADKSKLRSRMGPKGRGWCLSQLASNRALSSVSLTSGRSR
jgi:hypothetical protein